jgi:hypothetical protein
MDEIIQRFLTSVKVGDKQSHQNMTLYCLLAAEDFSVDFLCLDEALNRSILTNTEMNEAGNVPNLKVAKESARMKQKKPQSVTMNLKAGNSYLFGQGLVWDKVQTKFVRMAAPMSAILAMADLYEFSKNSSDEYLKAFRPVTQQIGTMAFIDGEMAGMEMLGKFNAFAEAHRKLLDSYVMDALETAGAPSEKKTKSFRTTVDQSLEQTSKSMVTRRQSVALGHDIRLESGEVVGTGLEFEGAVLYLSAFTKFADG